MFFRQCCDLALLVCVRPALDMQARAMQAERLALPSWPHSPAPRAKGSHALQSCRSYQRSGEAL